MVNVEGEGVVTDDFDVKFLVLTIYNTSGSVLCDFHLGGTEFTKSQRIRHPDFNRLQVFFK